MIIETERGFFHDKSYAVFITSVDYYWLWISE
jgi:hypothetical protein